MMSFSPFTHPHRQCQCGVIAMMLWQPQHHRGCIQSLHHFARRVQVQTQGTVLFGEFLTISRHHQRRVHIKRPGQAEGLLQQNLSGRVVCQVLTSHDMRDALVSIVNHHGQLVSP